MGFSLLNPPFWGTSIDGTPQIIICSSPGQGGIGRFRSKGQHYPSHQVDACGAHPSYRQNSAWAYDDRHQDPGPTMTNMSQVHPSAGYVGGTLMISPLPYLCENPGLFADISASQNGWMRLLSINVASPS